MTVEAICSDVFILPQYGREKSVRGKRVGQSTQCSSRCDRNVGGLAWFSSVASAVQYSGAGGGNYALRNQWLVTIIRTIT